MAVAVAVDDTQYPHDSHRIIVLKDRMDVMEMEGYTDGDRLSVVLGTISNGCGIRRE